MPENQNPPYRIPGSRELPKQFDVAPPRSNPQNFPAVGMTLNTYKNTSGYQTTQPQTRTPRRSAAADPLFVKKPSFWQRFKSKFTKKRVILFIAAIILIGGGYLGLKFVYNAQKLFGGSIFSALSNGTLEGESSGRVNILLAGNSADDPGHLGGALTDSIMIMSIDTNNKTAFMLSVPRDLYVRLPGHGHQKINSAYPIGEKNGFNRSGYAEGGMGQLQKTIYDTIGIKTHYYALVNYNALKDAVDSVGGVEITVNSTDRRGLYDPSRDYSVKRGILVKLSNGKHELNGQQALNFARARGDAPGSYGFSNSDFDRTAHQRQLILAIRSKATSAGVLTNPIKLGGLFDSIGTNVKTDLELNNLKRLYELTKDIPSNNIKSIGLNDANGVNLLKNYRTSNGASALIPAAGRDDFSDIQRYIQRITSNNLLVREDANVVLLNGTVKTGLAGRESDTLMAKNIAVSAVADADSEDYVATKIINLSGNTKPATLKALQKAYPGSTVTTTNPFGTKYKVDFIVILGSDRIAPATSSE